MVFEVYSSRDLRLHPWFERSRAIVFQRPREWRAHLPLLLANSNALRPVGNLGELHDLIGGKPGDWKDLLSLIAQGYVEVDMSVPLGPKMPVVACRAKGYRDA